MSGRRAIGWTAIALTLIATIAWKLEGSPTPQLGAGDEEVTIVAVDARDRKRPEIVDIAEQIAAGERTELALPRSLEFRRIDGRGFLVCDERACAALRRGSDRVLFTSGPKRKRRALEELAAG